MASQLSDYGEFRSVVVTCRRNYVAKGALHRDIYILVPLWPLRDGLRRACIDTLPGEVGYLTRSRSKEGVSDSV